MKKIWSFLKHHFHKDFNYRHYAVVIVFLGISISLNYRYEIEDVYLESFYGLAEVAAYFVFYSIAYYFTVLSYCYFYKRQEILKEKMFWTKSAFGLVLLSLDSSVPFLSPWIDAHTHPLLHVWAYKIAINVISYFTIFFPLLIFYFIMEKKHSHVYGLETRYFDAKPYFIMLLIMMPLLIAASFNPAFLRQYPMYISTQAHNHLGISEWVTVGIYEVVYGLDFVTVELLFRGFLVIGMITLLGRGSVLAMAVVYCFLHFGKPAGEAMSSVLGGYILGVIAYETRSIWGGIIVHIGIAWMMELIAFLRESF
jgi:hypothetical protein